MSNYLAIAAITSALKQLVLTGLQKAPWNFAYDLSVTTTPLDVARSQALEAYGQINLYLYHVGPNAAWRNEPLPRQVRGGETGVPPLALDLRYLITAYAPDNDGIEVHRVLGRALSVLYDHPILNATELAALPNSDVQEQVERIRLSPLTVSPDEMATIWNAFQKPYNLSVAWLVSAVLIDSTRATRAPLPVLIRASGGPSPAGESLAVAPSVAPVTPGIDSIAPPAQQTSVRLGEQLAIAGHLLAGALVRVVASQSRWTSPQYLVPDSVVASQVSVTLPSGSGAEAAWPAGTYTLSVGVTRTLGEAERTTNDLPFTLAPSIQSINPTSGTPNGQGVLPLSVNVSPQIWVGQRVFVIVGDQSFPAAAFTTQTGVLQFALTGLSPGKYRLRLRVDGVDSLVVDKTTTPPSFVGPELEVL